MITKQRKKELNERVIEYNGYSTFNDVEDIKIRSHNRGVIIINIIEDCTNKGYTKNQAWEMVEGYIQCIPKDEWVFAYAIAEIVATKRGIK